MIEHDKFYPVSDAARLVPSARAGRDHVAPATLRCWIRSGRLRGRKVGGNWWVLGADLLALLPGPPPERPAERKRRLRGAEARARELGIV